MNIFDWLSEYILCIAEVYQLIVIAVFVLFAVRIGDVRTLDDLLPEDSDN